MPGSIPITIPAPTVQYDMDWFWPTLGTTMGIGAAFITNGESRYGSFSPAIFSAPAGAGVVNMQLTAGGVLCAQFVSNGAGAIKSSLLNGWQMPVPLLAVAGQPLFRYPTFMRLWRWQIPVQVNGAANAAYGTAIGFTTYDGVAVNTLGPDRAGGTFFGITGDGAGNWVWQSKQAGGLGVFAETVALGIPITRLTVFDFVVLAATGLADAVAQLYVNGLLVLSRSWGVGSLLPAYALQLNAATFIPLVMTNDPAVAVALQILPFRLMAGHYQVSGAEV